MAHFSDQLVLFQWGLKTLGVDEFERLSDMLKAPEFEGWADHGGSKFVDATLTVLREAEYRALKPETAEGNRTIYTPTPSRSSELFAPDCSLFHDFGGWEGGIGKNAGSVNPREFYDFQKR